MNSEAIESEWHNVCELVKSYDGINASQVNAFFSRLVPQAMSEGFIMLTADNDFIKGWIERHYTEPIQRALKELHGMDFMVEIEVDPAQAARSESGETSSTATSEATQDGSSAAGRGLSSDGAVEKPSAPTSRASAAASPTIASPSDKRETAQARVVPVRATAVSDRKNGDAQADSRSSAEPDAGIESDERAKNAAQEEMDAPASTLTFENFVIGDSNRMAYSMAVAVAEDPGKPILNPLFIYGKSGLGKTHLMRAIQNYIAETMPEKKTVYVDSADFLSKYMEATLAHDKDKSSYRTFKNQYEDADVLLIDDVQYLQGKKQTLDIVFQIFNKLTDEGKQVVLSADRAPKNIDIDERYYSRFNAGGTFDIQPPEVETKLGIIKSFIKEYNATTKGRDFSIPDDIQIYIAENSSSNIRELKSAVTKVIYHMMAFGSEDISLDDVKRLLENHFSGGNMKKLTVGDIQKQVEEYYKVSHADLVGKKRARNIVYARQVAIYLSRQMLDLPYNYIAKSFGGRDHTTIMYSVTNIEEKMKESRDLREELETIRQLIREM